MYSESQCVSFKHQRGKPGLQQLMHPKAVVVPTSQPLRDVRFIFLLFYPSVTLMFLPRNFEIAGAM